MWDPYGCPVGEPERRGCACPACGAPGLERRLCQECQYASALARAVHPSAGSGAAGADERRPGDDVELWDAWALLGDPGCHHSGLRIE